MTTGTLISTILGIVTSSGLLYLLFKAMDKIEFWENVCLEQQLRYRELLRTIRFLDSKQMFEKDDEVGSVFVQIREAIEESEKYIIADIPQTEFEEE